MNPLMLLLAGHTDALCLDSFCKMRKARIYHNAKKLFVTVG
jgi:hypothetical protein